MRALFLLLFAATALTAAAQSASFELTGAGRWHLQEDDFGYDYYDDDTFEVVTTDFVTVPTVVSWSCSFPAIGFVNSGTVTFERGDRRKYFSVAFPWDGWYRDGHEGTISMSYTRNGNTVTETRSVEVYYVLPLLAVDALRVVEGDEDQSTLMRLTRPSHISWTLNVFADSGTADEGPDFSLLDHEITFPIGSTSTQVRFRAPKDGVAEGQETFTIAGRSLRVSDGNYPYVHGSGTITIDDADITASANPPAITIFNGDSFNLVVTLSRALSDSQTITASIATSDDRIVKPTHATMPLHAGHASINVPFETDGTGQAAITVSFPDAFAVAPVSVPIHVFGGDVAFERSTLTMRKNEQISVRIKMTPAPPQPVAVPLQLSGVGVLRLDDAPPIGIDGSSFVTFTALATGNGEIQAINRSGYIDRLTVTVIDALSANAIAPDSGSISGGTAVTITGTGFAGTCKVAFNGIAASAVTIASASSLRAIAPAHPAGIANVTVTCDGHDAALPSPFTFKSPARRRSVR